MKASRRRSFWRGVSLWREARKRLRTWVEGVACACAVTGRVLLDAATASMASAKRWSLCREHEGGSDARVAQSSPSGVPVKIEQSGVGEHARDRVGVRGPGEFVDNGRVGAGRVQCRKARTGHEARVGRAEGGSREVVVAVVVVLDDSSTECVVSCARVVVGAVGAFSGEADVRGFRAPIQPGSPG